ncbi:uncharacterized protein LOC130684907 isoform X4 [Manis pentadactyla]|uniref:uncharacterized protein LOC130684907 isoform X4 n=1 Tax=Manis pentadactyla TaxID=143292 RepID=UPI00255C46F7|nr:uncharacterized protein LOC130684907 isoform X4 [Manis pentadactyla]
MRAPPTRPTEAGRRSRLSVTRLRRRPAMTASFPAAPSPHCRRRHGCRRRYRHGRRPLCRCHPDDDRATILGVLRQKFITFMYYDQRKVCWWQSWHSHTASLLRNRISYAFGLIPPSSVEEKDNRSIHIRKYMNVILEVELKDQLFHLVLKFQLTRSSETGLIKERRCRVWGLIYSPH